LRQASSFTPIDTTARSPSSSWGAGLLAALDASAFSIPLSLGAVTVVYGRHAPGMLPGAVLVTLLGIALVQLAGLHSRRPVLFSARFLEATTLAALLDTFVLRMHAWDMQDTPEARVAALILIVAGAGLFMGLLYLLRADRVTRYIPTPVFAGFSNSIAVALVISQAGTLMQLAAMPGQSALQLLLVALLVFALGAAFRHWLPRWPATATALAIGLVAGACLAALGQPVPMVGSLAQGWLASPLMAAEFGALFGAREAWLPLSGLLVGDAAVLGSVMFLNSCMSAQVMSRHDDLPPEGRRAPIAWSLAATLAGLAGAAPLSGSAQASLAAARRARLDTRVVVFALLIAAAVALSGVLGFVPLAAVAGALLCEAWFMADRPSFRLLGRWLRREPLSADARENLALVAAVTCTAVFANMVPAVVVGFVLGLLLFAARNASRPVRAVLTGTQISSNCARPRRDVERLAQVGGELKVMELEGDLFFVAVASLERRFREVLDASTCVVVDWTGVRHVDTSIAEAVAKIERWASAHEVPLFHVDPARAAPEVAAALKLASHGARVCEDLDHALEQAENHLLAVHGSATPAPATTLLEAMTIFRDLDDAQRLRLEERMPQRLYRAGERVLAAGEPGDELLVVLQGSASIVVPGPAGAPVRLAGVRRGAVIGEMAFLDRTTRSADVVAQEDLTVAVLRRDAFDELSRTEPALVHKLLSAIAVDLAARLRHTNRLATARQARR
jgi:MFS superfamily sulfate permease-like transporter